MRQGRSFSLRHLLTVEVQRLAQRTISAALAATGELIAHCLEHGALPLGIADRADDLVRHLDADRRLARDRGFNADALRGERKKLRRDNDK